MKKPTRMDEQSQLIMQGILNEVNNDCRKLLGKLNNDTTRAELQYQIEQTLSRVTVAQCGTPYATDEDGVIYDFSGLRVVDHPYDPTAVNIEEIWEPRVQPKPP